MNSSVFQYGSTWVRADFHLHTKKDNEFGYSGEENQFVSSYISKLKESGIQVGVITNHNKFDLGEFKALRQKAKRENIFLLPGVELSIRDGRNGIHTLVVFSDDWIFNRESKDYITNFLQVTFAGQPNYENENGRSNHDILQTIRELNEFNKDYFFVFAHVEKNNGLWGGLDGRLEELGKNKEFKRRTLAFQKVSTRDKRTEIKGLLKNWYPAEVEGCDCKSLEDIGRGNQCYLKIGDFTFEAIKYALSDYESRVSNCPKNYTHSYIQSISFEGGILNGQTVCFSPELNTLIGVRGSGKSSILEAIRYVLDIPFGEKAVDNKYKDGLVSHLFGSGGKAVIQVVDRHGQPYEISRILGDFSDVYLKGVRQPSGISIRETILKKPIYFGQKDLSNTGDGFEKDLIEKLLGEKLHRIRLQIEEQKQRVNEAVDRVQKLKAGDDQKNEYEQKKTDAEHRLNIYKKYGVEEKLQKQVDFDTDSLKIAQIIETTRRYVSGLEEFMGQFEDDLKNFNAYQSNYNTAFFNEFFKNYSKLLIMFDEHKKLFGLSQTVLDALQKQSVVFESLKKSAKEEFAGIERALGEELKKQGVSSIRSEEFLQLKKTIEHCSQMLELLIKQQSQKQAVEEGLRQELVKLQKLWKDEFEIIQYELGGVNLNHSSLNLEVTYQGDKEAFLQFMKDIFKGSRIRESIFQQNVEKYDDFLELYLDISNVKKNNANPDIFEKYFMENLKTLLVWQVPNRFVIKYQGRELKNHSLGQRASALILFVLSQKENDVVIIDQPEDDLDNQTIYQDVVKLISRMKFETQFIFATHNANFPVLGDAEQIHSCRYVDDNIELQSGSVDVPAIQSEIVNIMEGGQDAFNKRKEIYHIWKPQNF